MFKNIIHTYIVALTLIATLSISAWFMVRSVIRAEKSSAPTVNISGRQRMLSQKIVAFALLCKSRNFNKRYKKILENTVDLMEKSHIALTKGSEKLKISKQIPPKVYDIYFKKPYELDRKVKIYIHNARSFIKTNQSQYVDFLVMASQPLLKLLDKAVKEYERYSHTEIMSLEKTENLILVISILLLIFEATFIFHPMAKKIRKKEEEIEELNLELKEKLIQAIKKQKDQQKIMVMQSRQAAMGEMIGAIAHQWRQPLNALALIIQDLKDAYEFGELDAEYIDSAVNNSMEQIKYMDKTINDFRDSTTSNSKKENFSLTKTVEKIQDLLKASLKNNQIGFFIDIKEDVQITGYENKILQALINLVNNAKDAINSSVKKQLIEKGKGKINIVVQKEGEFAKIIVSDNGGGIPFDIIDKVFEPYFTTKHKSAGTGIGLYMVKSIIEKEHKGKISVKNSDEGAEFTILIKDLKNEKENINAEGEQESKIVTELKKDHKIFISKLNKLIDKSINDPKTREEFTQLINIFRQHLSKEDQEIYPIIKQYKVKDRQLQIVFDAFYEEIKTINDRLYQFIKKLETKQEIDEQEFLKIVNILKKRIEIEEDILYQEYDYIIFSLKKEK